MKYINTFLSTVSFFIAYSLYATVQLTPINQQNARTKPDNYTHNSICYVVAQKLDNIAKAEHYLGNNFYLYTFADSLLKSNTQYYYITPESKIASDIDINEPTQAIQILYSKSISPNAISSILFTLQATITAHYTDQNIVKLIIKTDKIKEIAAYPFIYLLSKDYKQKNTLFYDAYIMNRLSVANSPAPFGYNLNGEGMKIGIWDDGIIAPHFNLENFRVFNIDKKYNSSPFYNHPTYVAGAVAMNNNGNYYQKAAASKSQLFSWDYEDDIIAEIKNGIEQYQINVSNHSYNFGQTLCKSASGLYIPDASEIDKIAHTYKDVVHVVAVGNTAHLCAINDTFYSTDIGYQGAKNTITVGYLYRDERLVETSGRGPTTDGRLKPELVTKGFEYRATSPSNGFTNVFGSSFAAPQIAGMAAVLQQYYKQQTGKMPPSSLVKATLCNTAKDLFYKGIDYATGFGRPDMGKALQNIENNRYIVDSVQHQQNKIHTFTLAEPQDYLAITVAWTDPASFPFQDTILVNDIDLKLITPNQDTILPWVLNPTQYKQLATRGIDKLNNIEHITLENLTAGVYTILVSGTNIKTSKQEYAVTYHSLKNGLDVVFPDGGEILDASTATNITWNQHGINDTLSVFYSIDSAQTWVFINKAHSNSPFLTWTVPANIATQNASIKMVSSTFADSSDYFFTIIPRLNSANLNITPCDKSANLSWTAIPNAQYYTLYLFENEIWKKIDTTSNLSYFLTNLINGNTYQVAITVTINGIESTRSNAKVLAPTFTSCNTTNDIGVYELINPMGGRQHTSTALSNNEKITFAIKNFGSNLVSNFDIAYQFQNGTIFSSAVSRTINPNDTIHFTTTETFDCSNLSNYVVRAWTTFASDFNKKNDTLQYIIKHVENFPISLPWSESFENTTAIITQNTFAIDSMKYADYYTTKNARWRTNAGNLFALSGKNALTLDNMTTNGSPINQHIITLNLSNYVDSIIYFDFNFMHHNEAAGGDTIFARGNDTSAWIPIYNLYNNVGEKGVYKNVKAINLHQLLKVNNNQNFSSSTQLKIQTQSASNTIELSKNAGYTFDDLSLYVANNDIENIANQPVRFSICLANDTLIPVPITLKNNSNQIQHNVQVAYIVNNQLTAVENIATTILPYDTFTYTFNQQLPITQAGKYEIITFVQQAQETYKLNDTSQTISYIANAYIQNFPYINNFEQSATLLPYSINNSSWIHGTPSKYYTQTAAEGNYAWSNSLFGNYNYDENSELYLGCFNFQGFSNYPTIAMHHLQNIQSIFDSAWAEYSLNGNDWIKLGCANCGTNWYNNTSTENKWDRTLVPWQVASTKLFLDPNSNKSRTQIRFKLVSNASVVGEGLAIDDIHLYPSYFQIAPKDSVYVNVVSNGSGWINVLKNDLLIAQIYDDNVSLGNIQVGYNVLNDVDYYADRTVLPRNWSIKPTNNTTANYKVRLYLLNSEYLNLITKDPNAQSMNDIAALRYNGFGVDASKDNNNISGQLDFLHQDSVHFVPFENGYYVEINTHTFGEFYLVGSKENQLIKNSPKIFTIDAQQLNNDAYVQWQSAKDVEIKNYVVQYSLDGILFFDIDSVISLQSANDTNNYGFIHNINAINGSLLYYRIKANLTNGQSFFSLVDSILFDLPTSINPSSQYIKAYFSDASNITIENKKILKGNYNIMLLQLDGKLIHQQNTTIGDGNYILHLPKNTLSENIYLLKIVNNKQTYFSKIYKP